MCLYAMPVTILQVLYNAICIVHPAIGEKFHYRSIFLFESARYDTLGVSKDKHYLVLHYVSMYWLNLKCALIVNIMIGNLHWHQKLISYAQNGCNLQIGMNCYWNQCNAHSSAQFQGCLMFFQKEFPNFWYHTALELSIHQYQTNFKSHHYIRPALPDCFV